MQPWKGLSCSPLLPTAAHELCPTCPAGVSGAKPARPSAPCTYGKEEHKRRTRGSWRTKAAGSLSAPPSALRPLTSHAGGLTPGHRGPAPQAQRGAPGAAPSPPPFSPGLPCPAQPWPPPPVRPSQLSPRPGHSQGAAGPQPLGRACHGAAPRNGRTSGSISHGRELRRGGGCVRGLSPGPGHGHGQRQPSHLSGECTRDAEAQAPRSPGSPCTSSLLTRPTRGCRGHAEQTVRRGLRGGRYLSRGDPGTTHSEAATREGTAGRRGH